MDKEYAYNETNGSTPNYVQLNEIIDHARFYKNELYEKKLSTKHLLLAVLSFENKVAATFSKHGIIYEDIIDMDKRKKQFLINLKRPPQIPLDIRLDYSDKQIKGFSEKIKTEQFNAAHTYAEKYLQYKDFEECDNCCNQMLRLNINNEMAYHILGISQYHQKNYAVAIHFLNKIDPASSFYKHALDAMSMVYSKQKKYDLAKEMAFKHLLIEPENTAVLNNIGFYFSEIGDVDNAITYLEKSIQLKDSFAFAHDNLGYCYFLKGELEKAIELIEHSLMLDKGNSFAYKNLALIYQSIGDKEKTKANLLIAKHFGYTEKYDNQVQEMLAIIENETDQQKPSVSFASKLLGIFKKK